MIGNSQFGEGRGWQWRTWRRQRGYILLFLVLTVALVLIALAMELPKLATELKRDREQELIHRGAQYPRAIRRYYKKFGNYPLRVEQLLDTNHMRFLRKRYKDPMTGEDFRLLHFGEVSLAPKAPGMGTGPGVATGPWTGQSGVGPDGQPIPPKPAGSTPDQSASNQSSSGFQTLSQMGATGPKIGGGPIIGVASTSEKQSLHIFNNKDHYNDWEFIYDPTTDRGALITGPYNGPPKVGVGIIPGAVTPGQMQPGTATPGQMQPGSTTSPFGPPQKTVP